MTQLHRLPRLACGLIVYGRLLVRFDDIDIVQAIDRHEDASNGAPLWSLDGLKLMQELAGGLVTDPVVHNGFVKEIHMLRDVGLLSFEVRTGPNGAVPNPRQNAQYYIQQVHSFALTVAGRDRARGRAIVQPVPDSAEDDGRFIPHSVIAAAAEAIDAEYPSTQRRAFLREAGVPTDRVLPAPDESFVLVALQNVLRRGSEGRRILRIFLGSWLNDYLAIGPTEEQQRELGEQLARQGWFVKGDRLVVGEPQRRGRMAQTGRQNERWRPLSQRAVGALDEPLIEDIPDWLYTQLQGWLYLILEDDTGPVKVVRAGQESASTQQVKLRLRTSTQPWLIPADHPAFIDALDASLRWIVPRRPGGDKPSAVLEEILTTANSVWRVDVEKRRLERRIDSTVTAAVATTRKSANTEAADHLQVAWDAAYGLYPDPDKAYDEAVLAVEALACPLVCPNNTTRRTLGTVIADLKNQASRWELGIGDSSDQPASPDRFIGMLEILWHGQSRHAGSPNSRRQIQAEGEAAVHLAATVVQWLTIGTLTRK
jgi:hypothetical protein